jgi:TonB family protein
MPPTTSPTTDASGSATAPVDSDCDETGCVLSKYDRPCCLKYKPADSDLKPRIGGVPVELDRAMVRAGVETIKPRVVKCGETSGAKGTVKITVTVAPEGQVTDAAVRESPDEGLGTCVAGAMRAARFGKSVNGGSFTYPFVF